MKKIIIYTVCTLMIIAFANKSWAANKGKSARKHWPKVQVYVQYPTYRGRIIKGNNQPIQLSVYLPGWAKQTGEVVAILVNNSGIAVHSSKKVQIHPGNKIIINVSTNKCDVGRYKLIVKLRRNNDKVADQIDTFLIHVIKKDSPEPTVWIDNHNRLIVHGQPMMPIGVYISGHKIKSAAKLLKDSAFNCAMPYGTPTKFGFNVARKNGFYIFASIKDYYYGLKYTPSAIKSISDERPFVQKYVCRFRNNPALLAWYMADEPSSKLMPRLKNHYRWVKELDPNHPAYIVSNHAWQVQKYILAADVIGMDWYKYAKGVKISRVTSASNALRLPSGHLPPVWMVIQAFNYKNYKPSIDFSPTPSPAELRNMIWQAIDNGSNGILLYSLYDIRRNPDRPFKTYWPKVKKIAAELNQWAPVLLSVEKSPEVSSKQAKTVIKENGVPWLSIRTATWHGRTFVFASNNTRKTRNATFRTSADISHVRSIDVLDKKHKDIKASNNTWQDTFEPLAVKMYELNGTGKKLPPPQNVHPPKAK